MKPKLTRTAATNVLVVSGTQITTTTTAHAAGAVTVMVTNPDTQSGSLSNGFTYATGASIGFAQVAAATPQSGVITPAPTTAASFYDTQDIVFSRSPGTRGYYQFGHWTERPQRVIQDENAFFGSSHDENVIQFDLFVDGGDGFAQPGRAGRFCVAAPMLEEAIVRARLEVQKLLDGAGLCIRAGEQVLGGELIFSEKLFDSKRFDLHARESGKDSGIASSTKLTCWQHSVCRHQSEECIFRAGRGMIRG